MGARDSKRVFRLFAAWADENEEAWLTGMARQGWHLVELGVFGRYKFERGEPRNEVYRLDFKTGDRDRDHYLQLFADAGWQHVGAMGGWQYFRKEAETGEAPEIYTDAASKLQKYGRVLLVLVIFLPIFMTMLVAVGSNPSPFMRVVELLAALLMILYAYAMVRILLRILQLKKRT